MMTPATLISKENGFCVRGFVGFYNVMALREWGEKSITEFSSRGMPTFVVDLSEMKELDAVCFSLLLCWMRLARQKNILLSVVNLSHSLVRMSKMFGLTEWIN